MKKFNLFALSIFAVALWSCTDKNDLGGNVPDRDIAANYISVTIVPAMETGTRVEANTDGYVDGEGAENYVNDVRFYFFDASGEAQAVKRNATTGNWESYYDYSVRNNNHEDKDEDDKDNGLTEADTTDPNVEKIIKATLVLQSPDGDKVPASLVAVVNYFNYDEDGKPTTPRFDGNRISSISDLMKKTGQFAKKSYGAKEGILMSSSVYKKENGLTAVELKLTPDDFKRTSAAAIQEPVTIYVERAVAKVSLSTDNFTGEKQPNSDAAGGNLFKLATTTTTTPEGSDTPVTSDVDLQINGQDIYVKFLGWNVTQTADKSYAVKNLQSDWTYEGTTAPFIGWTYPSHFRSFWALNPNEVTFNYTDFNGTNTTEENLPAGWAIKGISDAAAKTTPNYTYAPENAPQKVDEKRTEVLVAAQLVDKDGKAIKLAEFNGFKFMGDEYETEVLQAAANMINVWKKSLESGSVEEGNAVYKYESIQDYLKLVSAREAGQYDENSNDAKKQKGSYFTYVEVDRTKATGVSFVYFVEEDGVEVEKTIESLDELDAKLLNLPYIKFWTDGYTYYYVDIEHLNQSPATDYPVGKYGVVRNHWYDISVTKIYGLGTPVFDPSEKIIPEEPTQHESYLAAEIKILAWKLVKQDAVLGK